MRRLKLLLAGRQGPISMIRVARLAYALRGRCLTKSCWKGVPMKRVTVLLALIAALAITPTEAANDAHVKTALASVGTSGVTGFVQLHQAAHGGTRIDVHAKGLEPGSIFASFYYDNSDCTAGPDLVGTFTANRAGVGHVNGNADDDLDEIGSVSVRVGPGYGTLLACATVH